MILDVSPRRLEVTAGYPQFVNVTISNPGEVIGGYQVRVLGADPSWIKADDATISLFPQESTSVTIELTMPEGLPAGERQISIQVRELTPPEQVVVESVVLVVPEAPNVRLRVDPIVQQAGRKVRYAMLLDNSGNTVLEGRFAGTDPEHEAQFTFTPATVRLLPGEHSVIDVLAKAKQPFMGSPIVRTLNFYLDDPATQAELATQAKQAGEQLDPATTEDLPEADKLEFHLPGRKARAKKLPKPERATDPLAIGTFIQKARIGRGAISLLGLLAAVSIFALVITYSLSQIVKQSAADRDLALAIVAAQNSDGNASGSSSMGGTVRLLTSSTPVPGVAITLYKADDLKNPLATTATGADGTYSFENLSAGDYKVNYKGAGFIQLWYPSALDPGDAATVTVDANNRKGGLDVTVGGVAVTLSGSVTGADVAGATITLLSPLNSATTTTDGLSLSASTPVLLQATTDTSADDVANAAIVKTVAVGGDGTFQVEGVPSPSVYILQVSKPGYATSTQRVNVAAGENRESLTIALRQGDGVISGTVSDTDGVLEGATITATSGTTVVTTQSLADGTFTLRGLPTPGQVSVVASKEPEDTRSWGSQTMTVTLSSGQNLTALSMTLGAASGTLGGTVTVSGDSNAAGVLVTITDGEHTFTTATKTGGAWVMSGVPIPGTYTITFSRTGLAKQVVIVELDSNGSLTSGSLNVNAATALTINTTLASGTGAIEGDFTWDNVGDNPVDASLSKLPTVVRATCTESAACGSTVREVSVAQDPVGKFRIEGLTPGRYVMSVVQGTTTLDPSADTIYVTAAATFTWNYLYAVTPVTFTMYLSNGLTVATGCTFSVARDTETPITITHNGTANLYKGQYNITAKNSSSTVVPAYVDSDGGLQYFSVPDADGSVKVVLGTGVTC